jgi:hypothetical protein
MLKIYDEQAWRDLDIIRDIRNDFAHRTGIGSFSAASVRDRCENLKACETHFSERNEYEGWFISTAESSNAPLEMQIQIMDLNARLADARQRYLMCIQYYSAYLIYPFGLLTARP